MIHGGACKDSGVRLNAVEKDKFDPSLPLALRIAELFGLKIEDVFLRED